MQNTLLNRLSALLFGLSVIGAAFLAGYVVKRESFFPAPVFETGIDQVKSVYRKYVKKTFLNPAVYDRSGAYVEQPKKMHPGLTMLAGYFPDIDWDNDIRLVDRNGNVVHSWNIQPERFYDGTGSTYIHGTYLFPNGDVIVNVERSQLVRLNACGEVIWNRDVRTHHSVARGPDGNFWAPAQAMMDEENLNNEYPGLRAPANADRLYKFSPSGKALRDINVMDIIYNSELVFYLIKNGITMNDVTHMNDIEVLGKDIADSYPDFEAGDLLVSLRNMSTIFVMDPKTREVKWSLFEPLIRQHDPDFIGDGWIGVYNNRWEPTFRGDLLGGSEILAVQPATGKEKILYPTKHSDPFYAHRLGQWQMLENGNILTIEGTAGRAVEADPAGRTVWEWINERYDSDRIPDLTEATRVDVTKADVRAWECGARGS